MGDLRFASHYEKVRGAIDRVSEIEQMTDDELVQALGAASRAHDPYLANVLTTAVLNRTRRGRAVTETIGDGVCVVDREGVVTFANPAASDILGWTMKELQGTQFHAIVHHHLGPFHDQREECGLEKALASHAEGPIRFEDDFSPREGLPCPVYCTVSCIRVDGLPDSSVVLFQDMSERRRARDLLGAQARVLESAVEKTLAQLAQRDRAERRLESIFAAYPDAIVMTSPEGEIVLANVAAERMFGYGRGELAGQRASVLLPESHRASGLIPQGDARTLALPSAEPAAGIELTGRRKDGSEFSIEVRSSVVEDADGPTAITSIREVEQRPTKQLEAELALAKGELEREVAARTESLTRSYRELEAFSYSVSHDLQAPLRMLEFLVSSSLQGASATGETVTEDLVRMRVQVERLRGLVGAMLRLAKLGVRPAERSRVDISALGAQIVDELAVLHPERVVRVEIQPELSESADPALVRSLLENLLSNAWKYTSSREEARIWLGALPTDPPTFFVRDNGDGFDMRHAVRLFQPFSRLASAGEREGVGVGLASARRVVEGHGGRIWAEGAPGQGATFSFTLSPGVPASVDPVR